MKKAGIIKSLFAVITGRTTRQDINVPMAYEDANENYFADFRPDRFVGFGGQDVSEGSITTTSSNVAILGGGTPPPPVKKVIVKPKDVLGELGRRPTHFSLEGLAEKIAIVEAKKDLIRQNVASKEMDWLLVCLQNRQKYDQKSKAARATYREYFSHFDSTDQALIDDLLKKHSLVMREADTFIPELPSDATRTLATFTAVCDELCGKKPRVFVIANVDQFRAAYAKRDPILLAQSPFGFYYYILGAWDEEMLLLSEL